MFWNHCEMSGRQILQLLLGEGEPSMAIAAEIQNRSLTQALKSIARSRKFEHLQAKLDHFCNGYDTLLGYRNYYIHALMGIDAGIGGLLGLSAKGKLQYSSDSLSPEQIETISQNFRDLVAYGAAIQRDLGATGSGMLSLLDSYATSPETPQWPKTLEKRQRLIREG